MPLSWLKIEDFWALMNAEFRTEMPDVDPTIEGSWARAFVKSKAAGCLSLQALHQDVLRQQFPQTARDEFLDYLGEYELLPRNSATGSRGLIVQAGVAGTVIPVLSQYSSSGNTYTVQTTATITDQTGTISSITRSASTVTADIEAHGFANGQEITVSGANETEYNGTFSIVVLSADTFTYEVSGSPTSPATGTLGWASTFASILIAADDTGSETNLESGASLSADDITDPAHVNFDGLTGGASKETDDSYYQRIIFTRSIQRGVFTPAQIEEAARMITGNTRVFVIKPEISVADLSPLPPVAGQVAVYPIRDDDTSIIPSPTILAETKQKIIEYGKLNAQTAEIDILVLAATLILVDFQFASITPDTPTMRTAVQAQLKAFFEDSTSFATDISEGSYLGAIANTQDLETNTFLKSFQLTSPSADIIVDDGSIASVGEVSFV